MSPNKDQTENNKISAAAPHFTLVFNIQEPLLIEPSIWHKIANEHQLNA